MTMMSASSAAEAIRDRALTSEQLVGACLDRIIEREADVRAWVHLDGVAALAQAQARDAEPPRGPLHGVPVGVKDLIDTADQPTSYGSPIYAGRRPERDATCVARLRAAGAVILGKTVTTEFALFHPGPTANPLELTRTPGGSSSGSAAAVADGMVPLALGTQTAGSIVRPASYCGVFGGKPTFGLVPTTGVKLISPSLDTIGVLARDLDDVALGWSVLAGRAFDEPSDVTGRIAFARTYEWELASANTQRAVTGLVERLGLPEIPLPPDFATLVEAQTTVMEAEVADSLDLERRTHPELLSAKLHDLLLRGGHVTDSHRRAASDLATRCRPLLKDLFARHGITALVVPSVQDEAPVGLDATGDPVFCRIWTHLGCPAISVPGLHGPAGLPLGVQVVAPPGQDGAALTAARWLSRQLAAPERA